MTVNERLARLERENCWMRRAGGLALAAVACVVLIGQGKADELPDLVAKSLTIKGADGTKRAVLSATRGDATLAFYDKTGKTLLNLSLLRDFPLLRFYDKAGKVRTSLSLMHGMSALSFSDKAGTARMSLSSLGVISGLKFYDKAGKTLIDLSTMGGSSKLFFSDRAGKTRLGVHTQAIVRGGAPGFSLSDQTGRIRAMFNMVSGTPLLRFYDATGKLIWQAPPE